MGWPDAYELPSSIHRRRERLGRVLVKSWERRWVLLSLLPVHLVIVLYSYSSWGLSRCVAASVLFTVTYVVGFLLLEALIWMIAVAYAVVAVCGIYHLATESPEHPTAIVFLVVSVIVALVWLGPPVALAVLVRHQTESLVWAIGSGLVALGIWSLILRVLRGVVPSYLAGTLGHGVALAVLRGDELGDLQRRIGPLRRWLDPDHWANVERLARETERSLYLLLRHDAMPVPLLVWVVLLGIAYGLAKLDESGD